MQSPWTSAMTLPSLENLRCFLAAARLLSFRAAARTVALTPAAFGQRVRQLEEQIGKPLFARTTRTVTLTEAGLTLVPYAERCVADAGECLRAARGEIGLPPMELTLGTRQELGLSWVVPQLDSLAATFPTLGLHLYFGSGPDLVLRVRTMEIDCAVTSSRFTDPKLDSIRLHREDYAFVGASALLARVPLRRAEDAARHTLLDASADLPLFHYWRDAPDGGDRLRLHRLPRQHRGDSPSRARAGGRGGAAALSRAARSRARASAQDPAVGDAGARLLPADPSRRRRAPQRLRGARGRDAARSARVKARGSLPSGHDETRGVLASLSRCHRRLQQQ
jgi:DNA-binding transcriptional LysR family regulator